MEVPGYSLAERDRRWALARELMAAEGIDALLAYGEDDCAETAQFAPDAYFSNERPGSVVIFCRDANPVHLVQSSCQARTDAETANRGATVWIGLGDVRAGSAHQPGDYAAGVAAVLREHHADHAAVGALGQGTLQPWPPGSRPPSPLWCDVLDELPDVTLRPVGMSFMQATRCQSAEEIAVLRFCAMAGDAAVQAMVAMAGPGISEAEVYAAGAAVAHQLGCRACISPSSGWSGRPAPPRILQPGDVLLAGIASRFGMKETRQRVAVAIGGQHPDIETAAVLARACYHEGLRAARVGNTVGDLAEAMIAPLKQAGSWHLRPLARTLNPAVPVGLELALTPGMSWAFEPSAVIGRRSVSLGGTVVISQDDPIELGSRAAQLLRV